MLPTIIDTYDQTLETVFQGRTERGHVRKISKCVTNHIGDFALSIL